MTRTYRVAGMTCDGCVRAVANAVERRLPAAQIGIELAKGLMQVAGTPVDRRSRPPWRSRALSLKARSEGALYH